MNAPDYWKRHYVLESDAEEIARHIRRTDFDSAGRRFELITFEQARNAPNVLISQGTAGHAYVFAELAYAMHRRGYNVFVMPRHGSHTITELVHRHADALTHIADSFTDRIGVFAEGLGGYAVFYLGLAGGPLKSMACQNSPAILTEPAYHGAILEERGAASAARKLLPVVRILSRLLPGLRLPIPLYLDFRELIDADEPNRQVETRLVVNGYLHDPDFDTSYTLSAITSLLNTPPNPLEDLRIPTMFLVPS